jgi:hypothetical protein
VTGSWIGDDAPKDAALVQKWIDRAERLLRFKVPSLAGRITAATEADLLDTARDVVVSMVTRKFDNPKGYRTIQSAEGPFSGGFTYSGDSPGELFVTDEELSRLSPAGQNRGAFTVDMIPSSSPFSPNYVPPAVI